MSFIHRYRSWGVVAFCIAILLVYALFLAPSSAFPKDALVEIKKGTALPDIAQQLYQAHIVAHPDLLRLILRIDGSGGTVQAGRYLFRDPQNVFTVAYRLASGSYDIPPVRITYPEGTTVRDMAEITASSTAFIKPAVFIATAKNYEGYLFPDTYLFPPDATADSIVETMRANFDTKTGPLHAQVRASAHSLSDIVTMASLIEKEARTTVNRKLVAGVLWNRITKGMPLQVDAVFGYIYNRDTYSPSFADLTVSSPYNTYTHVGLPPGPIDNPGLDSLQAALNPTPSKYLYYLTDREGVMHYATTYAEHQANQNKYLH